MPAFQFNDLAFPDSVQLRLLLVGIGCGLDFQLQFPGGELVHLGIGMLGMDEGRAHDALDLNAELAHSVQCEQVLVGAPPWVAGQTASRKTGFLPQALS